MPTRTSASRRDVLLASGSLSVIGLAGCLNGEGSGDPSNGDTDWEWVVGTAGESTAVHGGTVALSSVISEHSDRMSFNPRTTSGTTANPRLVDQGDIDVAAGTDFNIWASNGGRDPYVDPFTETTLCQGIPTHNIQIFLVKRDIPELEGIETVQDIPDDGSVSMTWGAPGSSGFNILEVAFQIAGYDNPTERFDIEPVEFGDLPDAVREERIDLSISLLVNGDALPGYIQEMDAAADLAPIDFGWSEQEVSDFESPFAYAEINPDLFSPTFDFAPPALASVYTTAFPADLDSEGTYHYADVLLENYEEVRTYHDTVSHFGPDFAQEWMVQEPDVPVHPGVQDWLQENDMWDDSFPTLDDFDDPRN